MQGTVGSHCQTKQGVVVVWIHLRHGPYTLGVRHVVEKGNIQIVARDHGSVEVGRILESNYSRIEVL